MLDINRGGGSQRASLEKQLLPEGTTARVTRSTAARGNGAHTMPDREQQITRQSDKAANAVTDVSLRAVEQLAQIPAACMQQNMNLMKSRAEAYSEFAKTVTSSAGSQNFVRAYAEFGNRTMSDYVDYCKAIAGVMSGASQMLDGE
jgi:hypothetical protein